MRFYLEAKGIPEREQTFTNIRLGECWKQDMTRLDDSGGNLRPARGIQRGSAERRSGADDGRRHAGQPTGI